MVYFFPKSPLHVRFSFFFQRFFLKIPPYLQGGAFSVPPKCLCSPLVILFCSFQVHVIISIPTDNFFFFFEFCTWESEKKIMRRLKVKIYEVIFGRFSGPKFFLDIYFQESALLKIIAQIVNFEMVSNFLKYCASRKF